MAKENFIVSTLSLCTILNDNLEILLEKGWAVQSLKNKTSLLNRELSKTVDQILAKVDDCRVLNTSIDQDVEILKILSNLSVEKKDVILKDLRKTTNNSSV